MLAMVLTVDNFVDQLNNYSRSVYSSEKCEDCDILKVDGRIVVPHLIMSGNIICPEEGFKFVDVNISNYIHLAKMPHVNIVWYDPARVG